MGEVVSPSQPISVISDKFVFDRPVTLELKEKIMSWSGDDMTIKVGTAR